MTRHRELLESEAAGRGVSHLPRCREGDRRPGRPQSRDARRVSVPGRSLRGPFGGVHHARRQLRDPGQRGDPGGVHGGLLPRSLRDGGRGGGAADRDPHPVAARGLERVREGRAAGGRLGGGLERRRGVAAGRASSAMPGSAWRRSGRTPRGSLPFPKPSGARHPPRSCSRKPGPSRPRAAIRVPTCEGASSTNVIWPTN